MAPTDGGGGEPPGQRSWADILGSSLPPSWNKNVLELVLEKDQRGPFFAKDSECAKVLMKIGINLTSDVEAVQICPNGRGVIYVTLKNNTPVDNFLCHDVIDVNNSGLRVIHIKSAGKREDVMTL